MEVVQANEWRQSLQPERRFLVVNKIHDTLTRKFPHVGEENSAELRLIGARFENKIYESATSQSDYLRRISIKMVTMEATFARINASDSAFNGPPYDEY